MACGDWLDRDHLVSVYTGRGGELVSPSWVRMPDGQLVAVPAPCPHPAADCPPLPADVTVLAVAA